MIDDTLENARKKALNTFPILLYCSYEVSRKLNMFSYLPKCDKISTDWQTDKVKFRSTIVPVHCHSLVKKVNLFISSGKKVEFYQFLPNDAKNLSHHYFVCGEVLFGFYLLLFNAFLFNSEWSFCSWPRMLDNVSLPSLWWISLRGHATSSFSRNNKFRAFVSLFQWWSPLLSSQIWKDVDYHNYSLPENQFVDLWNRVNNDSRKKTRIKIIMHDIVT